MNPVFFDSIIIETPKNRIYSRLGYAKGKTNLAESQKEKVERYIEEALTFINLRGVALRLSIEAMNSSEVRLKGGVCFNSKALIKALDGCKELLIMGTTAGKGVMKAIADNSTAGDITSSVIFDAVASEMADAALDWIMNYFNRQLIRENKHFARMRFSAGYGDFSLDSQKLIYDILRMERIGVTLTKEYIFVPEKSVTAVIGIKPISN